MKKLPNYNKETLDLIFNEIKEKLNLQFKAIDTLDTKASIIIGFIGVMIGVILDKNNFTALGLLLVSMGMSIIAYFSRSYRRDPDPRNITKLYLRKESKFVEKQLIDNFIECFEYNEKFIIIKGMLINLSILLLFFSLIILVN